MISKNREDYLRAIYCISEQNNGKVSSVDIVEYLKVSKPAVSEMLKKLKAQEYITMQPYLKIVFTDKGFQEARKLTYKHRISELFLKDVLQISEKDLHEEAHRLEHAFSDKVIKKMAAFLKNPNVCPCGHKIPKLLSQFKKGEKVKILRISCGRAFIRRLCDLGLFEGTELEIIKNDSSFPIVVQILNSKIALEQGEANKIYGQKI